MEVGVGVSEVGVNEGWDERSWGERLIAELDVSNRCLEHSPWQIENRCSR